MGEEGREQREGGREGYLGVLIRCFVFCRGGNGTLLLSTSAHCTLLEIRAILLSRPSATLSSPFLLYLTQLLLFS